MPTISIPPPQIGVNWKAFFQKRPVTDYVRRKERRFLGRAGGTLRKIAKQSIKRKGIARKPPKNKYLADGKTYTKAYRRWKAEIVKQPASRPGTPPFTHTGALRNAIRYAVDFSRRTVYIGPTRSEIVDIGKIHEHGGRRKGKRYPSRTYMRPARDKVRMQLPRFWTEA